jgi:hypothetical protein
VRVEDYHKNSELVRADQAPEDAPATIRLGGNEWAAVERPVVSGANPDQDVDVASMYVTLLKKGTEEPLGTYLLTQWPKMVQRPAEEQAVSLGGTTYRLALRFQRNYKGYTIHLEEFRHEQYAGTDKPKDFSSFVRLVDPEQSVDREARIYMNHPLRYNGETFYQSSYKPGQDTTVLQVVRNPGWLMPSIACAMISGGLLLHFGLSLTGFVRKQVKTSERQNNG